MVRKAFLAHYFFKRVRNGEDINGEGDGGEEMPIELGQFSPPLQQTWLPGWLNASTEKQTPHH